MKPGLGDHRGQVECTIDRFGIALLYMGKAVELALYAVEVPVPVPISGDQGGVGNQIAAFRALDNVDRERQPRDPGTALGTILQIKLGRGGILDGALRPHVVVRGDQQVRLLAAHKVDVAHGLAGITRQGRRPDQAGCAVAQ